MSQVPVNPTFWDEYQVGACRTLNDRGFHDNVLHCTLGVAGEIGELISCRTQAEFIEEMGDFMWYAATLFDALEQSFGKVMGGVHNTVNSVPLYPGVDWRAHYFRVMVCQCSVVVDKVKRQIFYGKSLDVVSVAAAAVIMLSAAYEWAESEGVSLEDTANKNLQKLRVRYPDKFTEGAANNRDKVKEGEVFGGGVFVEP